MTHKCCVRDCEEIVKETRSKGLPLHKFPKDVLLRNKWLTSGGFEPDFKPTSSQIVCYKHFKQADYEIGRSHKLFLKKGSIPTIFDDYNNHPDPISPTSSFITSRLQAREFRLSQSLTSVEFDNSSNYFETSCSSLEASMDSSNSLNSSFTKKDFDTSTSKEISFEAADIDNINKKDLINSPSKILPLLDPDVRNISKTNTIDEQSNSVIIDEKKKAKMNDSKSKMTNRPGLNFMPGSKLEAKDFNEKWYSARVVETDWIEREVLIHFDKWSSRFDEWIPMDSSRLRVLQTYSKELKAREFAVGERILATWVDGKKYPAKVNAALENDRYDVLFDDGYSKILKASKMTKLLEISPSKLEEENEYIGSKQERRDKKRKHTITELFHSHSKKKIKNESDKTYKKQDITDVRNIKCIAKTEPTNSHKIDIDSGNDNFHNTECTGKIKKIKKEILKHNTDPEHTKSFEKISEESILGGLEEDYATYIGNLRVEIEDSTYKCPKSGCNKNFRKENLLQMHIKHYHPEYSKFLGSTPNVADLAYARTIGESVEDVIPKKSRIVSSQITQNIHGASLTTHNTDSDVSQTEIDNKFESKLSVETNISVPEDNSSEQSNSCTMSPGTLFDMRFKEEKTHTGIKTLPPVRQPTTTQVTDDGEQLPHLNIINDTQKLISLNDKGKVHRKKQYYSDSVGKLKKRRTSDHEENYDHFEDSLLDGNDTSDLTFKSNSTSNNRPETDNNDSSQSKNDNIMMINGELIKVEKLRREEIINCTCGITEEDGLMIQCDLCLCWQHGHCNAIEKEKDVPEKYICYICQHPHRQRASRKYFHDQDWIREGKLSSLSSYSSDLLKSNERTAMLKRTYDLIAGLLQLQDLLYSLRVKVNVAQNKDHPKLYLWAKIWSKIKIPSFKSEPVPIMEVIKSENCNDGYPEESKKDKLEFSFSTKNDADQKLITSNTELMKILEEDSTQADESKSTTKYLNNFKDEGRILLDALTRNGFEGQDNQIATIKNEINNHDTPIKHSATRYSISDKSLKTQITSSQANDKTSTISQPIIPEPEAPIDPVECKLRLLEHIDHFQNYVDVTLNFMEVQLSALENVNVSEKRNDNLDEIDDIQTKQTLQMLLHDLETVRKIAALC